MGYVNHYGIEIKRRGQPWEYVGSAYPSYQWRVVRPWYFLGLVRRPVICNDPAEAANLAYACVCASVMALGCIIDARGHVQPPANVEQVRVWRWRRGWFGRLTKRCILEVPSPSFSLPWSL